jgi:hypothetical protein
VCYSFGRYCIYYDMTSFSISLSVGLHQFKREVVSDFSGHQGLATKARFSVKIFRTDRANDMVVTVVNVEVLCILSGT